MVGPTSFGYQVSGFGAGGADPGTLELVQTQTISDAANVEFNSLQGSEYNVHLLTFTNVTLAAGNNQIGIRFKEGGTLETAANYLWAIERVEGSSYSEQKSTGFSRLPLVWYAIGTNTGANANGYCYFYNLHDSSKYSFITNQSSGWGYGSNTGVQYGSGALPQASAVDGIQIANYSAPTNISGIFSLYGIKDS